MQNLVYFIFIQILVNIIFIRNFEFIGRKYNLYDNPDETRKNNLNQFHY